VSSFDAESTPPIRRRFVGRCVDAAGFVAASGGAVAGMFGWLFKQKERRRGSFCERAVRPPSAPASTMPSSGRAEPAAEPMDEGACAATRAHRASARSEG
jgi:hypothetical protein